METATSKSQRYNTPGNYKEASIEKAKTARTRLPYRLQPGLRTYELKGDYDADLKLIARSFLTEVPRIDAWNWFLEQLAYDCKLDSVDSETFYGAGDSFGMSAECYVPDSGIRFRIFKAGEFHNFNLKFNDRHTEGFRSLEGEELTAEPFGIGFSFETAKTEINGQMYNQISFLDNRIALTPVDDNGRWPNVRGYVYEYDKGNSKFMTLLYDLQTEEQTNPSRIYSVPVNTYFLVPWIRNMHDFARVLAERRASKGK